MKKLLFAAMIFMASSAQATIYDMDAFAWTDDLGGGDGAISRSGSNTATIRGSADESGFFSITQMTSTSTLGLGSGEGDVSFAWDYTTGDFDSAFDPFVWVYAADGDINNVSVTQITTNGLTAESGTSTFAVVAGSLFGFSIDSVDNLVTATDFAFVTITDFAFDDGFAGNVLPTPVPPAFLLFGTALAGLGFFRKKKAAA